MAFQMRSRGQTTAMGKGALQWMEDRYSGKDHVHDEQREEKNARQKRRSGKAIKSSTRGFKAHVKLQTDLVKQKEKM